MSASILCIGKIKFAPYRSACDEYMRRLKHYVPVSEVELKAASKLSAPECKRKESETLLAAVPTNAALFALDERGTLLSSPDLAQLIQSQLVLSKPLVFAIGGALGHHEIMRNQAHYTLSLSTLTLPHELARVVLVEQLYRCMTILKNEPYHK